MKNDDETDALIGSLLMDRFTKATSDTATRVNSKPLTYDDILKAQEKLMAIGGRQRGKSYVTSTPNGSRNYFQDMFNNEFTGNRPSTIIFDDIENDEEKQITVEDIQNIIDKI